MQYYWNTSCGNNHAIVTVINISQYLFQCKSFSLPLNHNKTWYKLWEIQQYINFRHLHFCCRSIYFYNGSAYISLAVWNCQLVPCSEYGNESLQGILQTWLSSVAMKIIFSNKHCMFHLLVKTWNIVIWVVCLWGEVLILWEISICNIPFSHQIWSAL